MDLIEFTHRYQFKLSNIIVKIWQNKSLVIENLESIVGNIIKGDYENQVIYSNKRNQVFLNKSIDKGLLNRDLVIKKFNFYRKYDKFRFRFLHSKAYRSFKIAVELKNIGIKTPTPYIARDIRKMHDKGIIHNDLHAGNILIKSIDENPQLYYIDLNRARIKNSPLSKKIRMKDMVRFELSNEESELLLKKYDKQNFKVYLKEFLKQKKYRQNFRDFKKSLRNFVNR